MKVISLQEPYATFIASGLKKIETRSWKTNYRGELLIHASISKTYYSKIEDPNVIKLMNSLEMNYGKIICKVKLVDCIYMDKNFINKIVKNKLEYSLGVYKIGRYAWILDEIEILSSPINVKGKLNLWEYSI